MALKDYFAEKNGFGVLSTADDTGKVDAAAYAKPKVIDDTHIALIMEDKLSHANLLKNPHACYLFKEDGEGYEGKRLFLKMEKETAEKTEIEHTCKEEWPGPYCTPRFLAKSYLVTFTVEKELPLVIYDKK